MPYTGLHCAGVSYGSAPVPALAAPGTGTMQFQYSLGRNLSPPRCLALSSILYCAVYPACAIPVNCKVRGTSARCTSCLGFSLHGTTAMQ